FFQLVLPNEGVRLHRPVPRVGRVAEERERLIQPAEVRKRLYLLGDGRFAGWVQPARVLCGRERDGVEAHGFSRGGEVVPAVRRLEIVDEAPADRDERVPSLALAARPDTAGELLVCGG